MIFPGIYKMYFPCIEIGDHVPTDTHHGVAFGVNTILIECEADVSVVEIHKEFTHFVSPFYALLPIQKNQSHTCPVSYPVLCCILFPPHIRAASTANGLGVITGFVFGT